MDAIVAKLVEAIVLAARIRAAAVIVTSQETVDPRIKTDAEKCLLNHL
jgi:hypothetical protein